MLELTCEHGIGHSNSVHGCDGCCAKAFPVSDEALDWLMAKEKKVEATASLDTLLDFRDRLKVLRGNVMLQKMSGTDTIDFLIDNIERQVWEGTDGGDEDA